MSIKKEHRAEKIDYAAFSHLNNLIFPNEPVSEYEYQEFISANFWAIYDQDTFIGYSVMTTSGEQAHIRRIGIHPDFRSQGFATKLMDTMLKRAKGQNVNVVDLSVQQDNQSAINLYKKYGFRVTGESVQFSVPITPMVVDSYSIIPIDEYKKSGKYFPHETQILNWAEHHDPPQKLVLVFSKENMPVGFARFSPDFPGCSPFEIFTDKSVDDIRALVSLLGEYALPHKRTIKITTGNLKAIRLLKSAGSKENYCLYEMVKTLRDV